MKMGCKGSGLEPSMEEDMNAHDPAAHRPSLRQWGRIVALLLALTACSGASTLKWEETVILPDGREVVLRRIQHFDEEGYVSAHSFEFQHPKTKQTIEWKTDGFFTLVAIFMDGEKPYILVAPTFGVHNERAGCPYPSVFLYTFDRAQWEQIAYADSPARIVRNNTTMDPKADRQLIENNNYRLPPGGIHVRDDPIRQAYLGLNLDKFPGQVFQCPEQKRIDFK